MGGRRRGRGQRSQGLGLGSHACLGGRHEGARTMVALPLVLPEALCRRARLTLRRRRLRPAHGLGDDTRPGRGLVPGTLDRRPGRAGADARLVCHLLRALDGCRGRCRHCQVPVPRSAHAARSPPTPVPAPELCVAGVLPVAPEGARWPDPAALLRFPRPHCRSGLPHHRALAAQRNIPPGRRHCQLRHVPALCHRACHPRSDYRLAPPGLVWSHS
mmetsp:Transcript_44379/g.126658  ORF Transcript_44379/g.126658 Transcript_44379/m.126658 type:complete len:216 (-) Transcript_44379:953-1600(-)